MNLVVRRNLVEVMAGVPGSREFRGRGLLRVDERSGFFGPGGGDGSRGGQGEKETGRDVGVGGGGGGAGGDDGGGNGGGGGSDHEGEENGERQRWITVASFSLPTEAHLARLRLESEGVDCLLIDEHTVSTYWFLSPALGGIKLQVPQDQLQRAREVLQSEQVEWDESEAIDAARCRACGAGEYEMAPIPGWAIALSIPLLGIPLLFLPRHWRCERCGEAMNPGGKQST